MQLATPRQWEWMALVPIITGLYVLTTHTGWGWYLFAGVPGFLVLASGAALLLMPGDPRVTSYMALGGAVGVLLSLFTLFIAGFVPAVTAAALFAASFIIAGRVGLRTEPVYEGAPTLHLDLKLDAKAGMDEAMLGYFLISASVPSGNLAASMCDDALKLEALVHERGWLADPDSYHRVPPTPDKVRIVDSRAAGHNFEEVSFDSAVELPADLPNVQSYLSHASNSRAVARVLRHRGAPRPWIMCIHGYRMGIPWMDFSLFSPAYLHEQLGLNVIMPILPLHGSRKIGRRTGDHYLDGDLLDLLYAETQAIWDLRRWLLWIRSLEEKPSIGAYGVSLGGYNASLLAQYDDALDFIVAGVPIVDLASGLWRYVPPMHQRYLSSRGLDEARYREILKLVSPLARAPLIDKNNLHIFGAAGDRIVAPRHPMMLSQHWDVPVTWYQGTHLSLRHEKEPRQVIEEAAQRAGWRTGAYIGV